MSVYGMKPQFVDRAGYNSWLAQWSSLYQEVSQNIRTAKRAVRQAQREHSEQAGRMQRELVQQRAMGTKLNTVLAEARIRWNNIRTIRTGIEEQHRQFPLDIQDARGIDFHFNKKHLEFNFVPMWILRAKGVSYYLNNISCEVPCSTRETPDHASTKASVRVRRGNVHIDAQGNARITPHDSMID